MKLDREVLLERFYARDAGYDGAFVVGVLSTGIYCIPSCPARRPKPENVQLFDSEEAARASGLRACRRCRPDFFYRDHDPDLELARGLAERVRGRPGDFADAAALARRSGIGATKLGELCRRFHHATPAALLTRARVDAAAKALLFGGARLIDVALDAGFESQSTFHEQFARTMGMTPGAYRKLASSDEFSLRLPDGFRRDELFAMFGRDAEGRTERVAGARAAKALVIAGRPMRIELEFGQQNVRCILRARGRKPGKRHLATAHAVARRLLGLTMDPGPFERRVARRPGLSRLIRGRRGLRIPQTSDAFEGLLWVIVGQQVNIAFAATCRDRVIELCGRPAGDGFLAHPTAADVAELTYDQLTARQFSRRKAEYLIDTARLVADGSLELEALRTAPAPETERQLLAVRGLGRWSVAYLLMRSFGFEDCVPAGDSALATSLQTFFELDERPDADETLQHMEPFAPHRSFATFHLWKRLP